MKNSDKVILTNQGKNLLNKALSGTTLKFTKVVLGDGIWDDSINPEELTDLINPVINSSIREFTNLRNGTAKLKVVASNTKLDHDVFIREIGVYADDPDLGEILYSVTYLDEPYFIPEELTKVISTIDVYTTISNAQNVTAIIDYIQQQNIDPNTYAEIFAKIDLSNIKDEVLLSKLESLGITNNGSNTVNFNNRGVWDSSEIYNPNDIVSYNNGIYVAVTENTGKQPDLNPDIWKLWFKIPNLTQLQEIRDEVLNYKTNINTTYTDTVNFLNSLENLARALQQIGATFFYVDANNHLIVNYSDPIKNVILDENKHLIIEY